MRDGSERCHPASTGSEMGLSVATQLAKLERVAGRHDARTCDGVADGCREEVLDDRIADRQVCTAEHAEWQKEHVGDRVLETDGHKRRDWEPDANHLACKVVGGASKPDSHTDKPIAKDCLHNGRKEGAAALLDRGGNSQVLGAAAEDACVLCRKRKESAADDVADIGEGPALDQIFKRAQALVQRCGHGRAVASEELATRHQDEQEVDREECCEDKFLEAWV
mmetsp:Transcript_44044/g.115731  ORF Transcript_44044/g.115731 Transcript_44044/m.115731 type:complete len:223 (-) Transcript_44044:308-976(-)